MTPAIKEKPEGILFNGEYMVSGGFQSTKLSV